MTAISIARNREPWSIRPWLHQPDRADLAFQGMGERYPRATVAIGLVEATVAAAEELGCARPDLLRAADVDARQLLEVNSRVELRCLAAVDDFVRSRLGPNAAILLSRRMAQRDDSMLAYICSRSNTLRDFFENLCRYRLLDIEIDRPTFEVLDGRATFACQYPRSNAERFGATLLRDFATWFVRAKQAIGQEWTPLEVHLQVRIRDLATFQEFFGAPVCAGATGFRLVFCADLLDTPLVGADRNLLAHLRPVADATLAKLHEYRAFADVVRSEISRLVQFKSAGVADVASALAMSPRTLQRRLEAEGTTFGAVYDDARRDLAFEHLRNPDVAIKQAAVLAGYSEPSTFYRAFRRWTGATPATYRRALAPTAA